MGCESSVREPGILAGCEEGSGGDEAEDGEKCEVEAEGWREGLMAFIKWLICMRFGVWMKQALERYPSDF